MSSTARPASPFPSAARSSRSTISTRRATAYSSVTLCLAKALVTCADQTPCRFRMLLWNAVEREHCLPFVIIGTHAVPSPSSSHTSTHYPSRMPPYRAARLGVAPSTAASPPHPDRRRNKLGTGRITILPVNASFADPSPIASSSHPSCGFSLNPCRHAFSFDARVPTLDQTPCRFAGC